MKKEQLKQAFISILVGACVAFLTSLFDALSTLLKSHSQEIISGASATAVYLAKAYKAE